MAPKKTQTLDGFKIKKGPIFFVDVFYIHELCSSNVM